MKKFWTSVIVLATCLLMCGIVQAQEVDYGTSDIERMYITCDTELSALTKESYVDAKIVVVNKDGSIDTQDLEGKVKLRGNSTSKAEKRPVNIKLSSKESILGMDKGKKWCILANAFDKSLIRNALCFDLANKMGLSFISQYRYIDLYFNDVYEGSYMIAEPVDPGSNLVDIEEEGDDFLIEVERERWEDDVKYINTKAGVRFAINVPEEPTDAQIAEIEKKLSTVETALKTYRLNEYSKYIDVKSFVDFYIVAEIFKAVDFNYSSTRFYMKDGVVYAGPVWDVDLSSGNASPNFYKGYYEDGKSYTQLFCTEMKWYNLLFKSDEFIALVNERYNEMLPTIENMFETNLLGTNVIDTLMANYKPSFIRNYDSKENGGAGWSIVKRYSICDNEIGLEFDPHPATYEENVEFLRTWLNNRVDYLKEAWATYKKNNRVEWLESEKITNTKIYLSWYSYGIADGFEVYAKANNGKYKLVKTIKNGDVQDCNVSNLKPGVKYKFKVKSFVNSNDNKLYSDYSNVTTRKTTLKKVKVKVSKKGKKVTIKWNKISGVDGYVVYKVKNNGKLKKIKTIKKAKTTKYIVKKSTTKKYKVKAFVKVNGKTIFSK